MSADPLRAAFERYNEWVLDYDREWIEKQFLPSLR
ncbi:DUF3885 domain-containing protein [Heliobacterium gestii]|uniref:DUF3885 domain-containing protein n=1 Tax=Heliomicrobium gestii TaxID=2699 RepID=A0A845LFR0_HELGE|nr:DUF3885 domain-containing protein [Heliomicrobium gestii]